MSFVCFFFLKIDFRRINKLNMQKDISLKVEIYKSSIKFKICKIKDLIFLKKINYNN